MTAPDRLRPKLDIVYITTQGHAGTGTRGVHLFFFDKGIFRQSISFVETAY